MRNDKIQAVRLLFAILAGFSQSTYAESPKPMLNSSRRQETRLIIQFDREFSNSVRVKMHRLRGGQLRKHFTSINADLVAFDRPASSALESSDEKFAQRVCRDYLNLSGVKFCEPDRKLKFPVAAQVCSPSASAVADISSSATKLLASASEQFCEVIPKRGLSPAQKADRPGLDGKWNVSPLWGQQAIGADLATELVERSLTEDAASRVPTGNMDVISDRIPFAPVQPNALKMNLLTNEPQRTHGDSTADLVAHPPFGSSPAVTWSAIVNLSARQQGGNRSEAWDSNLIEGLEATQKTSTRLVTASIGYFSASPRAAIDHFVDSGRMFVQASGNDYPVPSWSGETPHSGHIVVGSVGPNSLPSPFSQEPVKIYAPSDGAQLSGPNETFGGTSGATPLVTGSIVNALAFVPDLTNQEIESLLERTSLPTLTRGQSEKGPGIVNSYRMAVVANCLATQDPDHVQRSSLKSESAANSRGCFDQSKESYELRIKAERLLQQSDCVSQREGLNALRASFLLTPTRATALKLAALYEKHGYPGDARWYHTQAAALGTPQERLKHFENLLSEPSLTDHRYFAGAFLDEKSKGFYALSLASRLPKDHEFVQSALNHISKMFRSKDPEMPNQAIKQAMIMGPRALPLISNLLEETDDAAAPRSASKLISKLTIEDGVWHPWIDETKAFFKGSRFEKYLPKSSPAK